MIFIFMGSNSQAESMSNLPLDITINIFSRLPPKSLGQLKCTCKLWNSLISSPSFVKLQHDRAILDADDLESHFRLFMSMVHCYLLDYESPSSLLDLSRSLEVDTDKILGKNVNYLTGSCYGFIYFVCYQDCIIIWNPCTKQAKNLTNHPKPSSDAKYFYGLGYENDKITTCEYKMVRIIQWGFPKSTEVEVFDLRTSSSWRKIEAFEGDITILDKKGTFANGALHWKAICDDGLEKYEMILSLDMRNETFREILIPKFGDRSGSFWCLGDSKGRLFLQVGGDCNDLDVWEMKEYGVEESWTRLVIYKWRDFDCDYGLCFICFAKNGDGILNADGWHLVRFDSVERRSRYYKKLNDDWYDCYMYVESLVSPHGAIC